MEVRNLPLPKLTKPAQLLLAFLLAIGITGDNARAAAQATEIEFWHSMGGAKGRLLSEIVDGFNKREENRGRLRVRVQYVGNYDEGLNKLRTALIAHRGPHVVQITDIGQQMMIDSGTIEPLYEFIEKDPSFPLNELLRPVKRYYEFQGRLYSLPFATSNPVIYFNRDAFDAAGIAHAPTTYAELEEVARKLTRSAKGGGKITGLTWPLHAWFFEEFVARQGATLVDHENGRAGRAAHASYNGSAGRDFVALWLRMVKNGSFANVGRGWDPAEQNFLAGRTMMLITSTSDIFEISRSVKFKLGTAPIPGKDANARGGTIVGGNSLWILKDKPKAERDGAYAFIKYMASADVQEKWHSGTGYFPIRGDVIESLKARGFYERYPAAWTAIEQLRSSPDLPATQGASFGVFQEAREHIMTAIEEALSGRSDIETALKAAEAKTDSSLMRYNRGL